MLMNWRVLVGWVMPSTMPSFMSQLYMIASAPHLPPCGLNNNSSRTWVSIYDNDDTRLYGFCGFDSSNDLDLLWFAVPKGTSPPDSVYIVLNDRECDITYTSNLVALSKQVSLKLPDKQYKLVSAQTQKLQSGGSQPPYRRPSKGRSEKWNFCKKTLEVVKKSRVIVTQRKRSNLFHSKEIASSLH